MPAGCLSKLSHCLCGYCSGTWSTSTCRSASPVFKPVLVFNVPASTMSVTVQSGPALNILLFLGSVREQRMATRVGRYFKRLLESRGHIVTVLDPKELGLAEVHQPLHFHPDQTVAPAVLHETNRKIQTADGFIVISGEYNSCIPPALTALMDHFPPSSYAYRPSAIVTYSMGIHGGLRAAMQLRQFLSDLSTVHIPAITVISKVHEALTEDGVVAPTEKYLARSSENLCKQFEWYADAIKKARQVSDGPMMPLF